MPRCDTQLAGDLTESQAKPAEALGRGKAIKTPVQVGVGVEFIHKGKLAMTPCPSFRQHALDESPRALKLLRGELLRRGPAPTRPRISRQVLGVDVVSAMRPTDG